MNAGPALRLVQVRLQGYGRLRDFAFEPERSPGTVVLAPNEAGKSTLVSSIRRGLFGFVEKSREDARRPWESGPFRVTLRWELGSDASCTIERDFDTQAVQVEWRRGENGGRSALESRWEGSPNPRGRSVELDQYRAELQRLLGFSSPEIFHQTALVDSASAQVRPLETELLRLLSGGERADFRAGLEALESAWYEITQADLEDPFRRAKQKPRRLEELEIRRGELAGRREESVLRAGMRRQAEETLARAREELVQVERELEERGRTRTAIDGLRAKRAEIAAADERLSDLDGRIRGFQEWEETFRTRELELRPLAPYLQKPADYAERLTEIERLDGEIHVLRARPARPPARERRSEDHRGLVVALSGGAWILGGLAAGLLGAPLWATAGLGAVGMALLLAAGGIALWARRPLPAESDPRRVEEIAAVERRREDLARELGLPAGESVARERERFRQAQSLRDRLDGMKEAHGALGDRAALESGRRELKEGRLDVLRLEERRILDEHPYLAGEPDYERRFLEETRRAEERRIELARLALEAERRLATLPVPADDPAALDAELAAVDREREAAELERDAVGLAHRTLLGCKDEFVKLASTRLAAIVSEVFADLTGGRYRTVRIDPASFELSADSPERLGVAAASLSRGTRDQLWLALRVAILETLAPERALPLVLDDPFLHFDDERLALAGRALARVGARHQVLLFTHDSRLTAWDFPQWVLPAVPGEADRPSGD
ncbi:MAG TPA: AAA family ATPase [Gemmatimonadota bacterium]|nr:AAA family ATPase [Gemmatimonadota bacterium]